MKTLFEKIDALKAHYGQAEYVAEVSRRRLDPAGVIHNEHTIIKGERECIEDMYDELQKVSEDKPANCG